jgi:hypothetical protein
MKESSLSPTTRALLQAAKSDGPRAAARAKMWGAVSTATGIAAAAQVGSSAGSAVAASSSAKLVLAGALFGSALTVGIALAVVRVVAAGSGAEGAKLDVPAAMEVRQAVVEENAFERSRGEPPAIPLGFSTLGQRDGLSFGETEKAVASSAPVSARPTGGSPVVSGVRPGAEDSLWREESLILEARGALRRGNPEAALASLDAAHRVGSHKLEPEELSVRAKTLRALGRDAEADEVWAQLKTRYPDQAR